MISSYMHVYMSWATNKNYFQYQWILRLLFTLIDLSLLHSIRENSAIVSSGLMVSTPQSKNIQFIISLALPFQKGNSLFTLFFKLCGLL